MALQHAFREGVGLEACICVIMDSQLCGWCTAPQDQAAIWFACYLDEPLCLGLRAATSYRYSPQLVSIAGNGSVMPCPKAELALLGLGEGRPALLLPDVAGQ